MPKERDEDVAVRASGELHLILVEALAQVAASAADGDVGMPAGDRFDERGNVARSRNSKRKPGGSEVIAEICSTVGHFMAAGGIPFDGGRPVYTAAGRRQATGNLGTADGRAPSDQVAASPPGGPQNTTQVAKSGVKSTKRCSAPARTKKQVPGAKAWRSPSRTKVPDPEWMK